MSKQIIIATHTFLAEGFIEAFTFLVGENNIYTIAAYTQDTMPERTLTALLDRFEQNDTVVILTDLKGGSVNQFTANLLQKYHFYLVTGINLGLVLEIALLPEECINDDSIRHAVSSARNDLIYMNDELNYLDEEVNDESAFFE